MRRTAACRLSSDEFITAQAKAEPVIPHTMTQNIGNQKQGAVTFRMAVGRIDMFQKVYVEQRYGKQSVVRCHPFQRRIQFSQPGPAVGQESEIVAPGCFPQMLVVCNIKRLLQMRYAPVDPGHEAVVVFEQSPGQRIVCFPMVKRGFGAVFFQKRDGAELAAALGPLLQDLPADFPFRVFEVEIFPHGLIHVKNFVRTGIGDANANFCLSLRRVENMVTEALFRAEFASGQKDTQRQGQFGQSFQLPQSPAGLCFRSPEQHNTGEFFSGQQGGRAARAGAVGQGEICGRNLGAEWFCAHKPGT